MNELRHLILFYFLFLQLPCLWAFKKCPHKIFENSEKVLLDEILGLHNKYRNMIVNGTVKEQPKATPNSMNTLKWDSKLEKLALDVSRTCEFEHVEVKTAEFPNGLGQNLYRSCSNKRRKQNWGKVIGDWFKEYGMYSFPSRPNEKNGHYTQLIWGATRLLGCSYTDYFKEDSKKAPYCKLYVCQYAPRGNIIGKMPYKPDAA